MYYPRVETCSICGKDFWSGPHDNKICFSCSFPIAREKEARRQQEEREQAAKRLVEQRAQLQKLEAARKNKKQEREIKAEAVAVPLRKSVKELERERDLIRRQKLKYEGHVYLMRAANEQYKIGLSKDVEQRRKSIEREFPVYLEVIHTIYCQNSRKAEKYLHKKFRAKRVRYEWFKLNAQDVEWIMSLKAGDLDFD